MGDHPTARAGARNAKQPKQLALRVTAAAPGIELHAPSISLVLMAREVPAWEG